MYGSINQSISFLVFDDVLFNTPSMFYLFQFEVVIYLHTQTHIYHTNIGKSIQQQQAILMTMKYWTLIIFL